MASGPLLAAPTGPRLRAGWSEPSLTFLRRGFFYGRSFRDLEDLNTQVASWLKDTANARVHGTTGEVPRERLLQEHSNLTPLASAPTFP